MVEEKTWDEFRSSGLLWFVNRIIHLFGWAIVVELGEDDKVIRAYPSRCKFRGFDLGSEEEGFINLSQYLEDNIKEINKESKD